MIPRRLHFTWLGPNPLPERYAGFIEGWRRLHPDWDVTVWTDENRLRPLYNEDLYRKATSDVMRSDILRHEVLHAFGGIYLDCDVEPVRPLDPLTDCEAFACDQGRGLLGSAALGADCHLPVWEEIMAGLDFSIRCGGDLATMVGPGYITPILRGKVTELPQACFYPYLWDEPERPPQAETYGIHRWAKGW